MIRSAIAQTDSSSTGLPQFDAAFFTPQIFWEGVTFLVLLYLMTKFVIPRINRLLERRAEAIRRDIEAAARNRRKSEQMLTEYQRKLDMLNEEADTIMTQAHKKIIEKHAISIRQFEEDIRRKKLKFREELEFAEQQSMKEIRNISTEVAILAAEKLIEKNVDKDDAKRIVEDVIQEMSRLKDEY